MPPRSNNRHQLGSVRQQTVRDMWGERWLVDERRPTQYRFAVYMGWHYPPQGLNKSGKAAVIVTPKLAAHMRANAQRPYAYPLPIGDNARRRIRDQLGIGHREWIDTRLTWWFDRIDDLGTLSSQQFVDKHGASGWTRMGTMSTTLVWQMRTALLGKQRRPAGWWRKPEVSQLVRSRLPSEAIAKQLRLAPATVYGIRYRLKKMGR